MWKSLKMISGNESELTTLFPEFSGRRRVRIERAMKTRLSK